jgi:hypothetical protein
MKDDFHFKGIQYLKTVFYVVYLHSVMVVIDAYFKSDLF